MFVIIVNHIRDEYGCYTHGVVGYRKLTLWNERKLAQAHIDALYSETNDSVVALVVCG